MKRKGPQGRQAQERARVLAERVAQRTQQAKRTPTGKTVKQHEFVRAARLSRATDEATAVDDFTDITDIRKRLYLQELCRTPRFAVAAKLAGISLKTEYNWRHDTSDTAWMEALATALKLGIARAESEAWRRGMEGVEVPVFHNGRMVATKTEFSDGMLQFMLKGARPEKYRERFELTGKDGGPIQTQDLTQLSDAELASRAEMIITVLRATGAEPAGLPSAPQDVIDVQPVEQPLEEKPDGELEQLKAQYEAMLRARNGNGNGSNGHG